MSAGSDAKFFQRGKVQELRSELQDDKKDKGWTRKKTVLKKIIANATMGNDMSALFGDVVACMNIQVLEIKKMVYLYLVNYGRAKPDLLLHAIPGFLSDCHDRNPLIRALAIRTMSYIHVPAVTSALLDPLRHSLKDTDPYVRKTAAICVAKLYMHDRRTVDREGYISMLRDLLADSNPTVVANAVAALTEVSERSDNIQLKLNLTIASKLVSALNECSEWGQAYILEALMFYVPQESADASILAERIVVRLQHANSAVVLTSVKVILYLVNYISHKPTVDSLCRKLSPPLVTLLSSGPEVQYVALRNILLVIQRRPVVLQNEVKVFFCKYNDPIYVKLAKLEIMYRLASERNVEQVLAELREYASEVDVDFVRKAVRSIGRLAIKIESAADRCISVLLSLIHTKVNYVVQEAVVVIKDIFRKYPNQYEGIIGTLCENLDVLDEPEAKASMIWIIGQYADRIENSEQLLEDFLESFLEEPVEVQLSLLTATVKLFIMRPTAGQDLVPKVLKWATEEVENPDLRDRGIMYWRMLSADPVAARDVVLAEKPGISTETDRMDRALLDQLLLHAGTLSSIFHRQPQTFIRGAKPRFLPDSPALDPSARRHASAHIHSKPIPRPPPALGPPALGPPAAIPPAAGATIPSAVGTPPPRSTATPPASVPLPSTSPAMGMHVDGGDETAPVAVAQDGEDARGPPSPAHSGIAPVAFASTSVTGASAVPPPPSPGGGALDDSSDNPYAQLGIFDQGYAADAPAPAGVSAAGLDGDLLS